MKLPYSILPTLALALTSCTSSRINPSSTFVTFEVATNDVRQIEASGGISVFYTQSPETSVTVKSPDNIVDYVKVEIKDGILNAYLDFGTFNCVSLKRCDVSVYVNSPILYDISASSSASVSVKDGIKISSGIDIRASSSSKVMLASFQGAEADIESSSSSNVTIDALTVSELSVESSSSASVDITNIHADAVSAEVNSSASVNLAGLCTVVDFETSSSGRIDASALRAAKGKAEASSSSHIKCSVDKLTQSTSSSASISNI